MAMAPSTKFVGVRSERCERTITMNEFVSTVIATTRGIKKP